MLDFRNAALLNPQHSRKADLAGAFIFTYLSKLPTKNIGVALLLSLRDTFGVDTKQIEQFCT